MINSMVENRKYFSNFIYYAYAMSFFKKILISKFLVAVFFHTVGFWFFDDDMMTRRASGVLKLCM